MRHALLLFAAASLAACDNGDDAARVVGELASDRVELVAETNEPIIEILVAEGSAVEAGDVLLRQDASRATARLAEADGALNQAEARLAELVRGPRQEQIDAARANHAGAREELAFRRLDHERARDLAARDLASKERLDRAKAALETAAADADRRRAELDELLAGTTVEELLQAEASVEQAQARRDAAAIDVERHEIRAPVSGIADTRLFEPGERPNPGQPVMVLLGGNQVHARVYIPEPLRASIEAGTRARVFVDGLSEPVDGRVRWVASEAAFTPYFALTERDRSRLSFVAKIDLDANVQRLPDGVPVEAEFVLPGAAP